MSDGVKENPFVGLRPFRTDEDYLFFGREEQTVELVRLLREHRFLAVVGTSGSGKSSLVRAGLMPALQGGTMTQAGSSWEIVIMRPGGSPRRNLAQALVDADFYDPDDAESLPRLEATLNRSRQGLVEAVRQSDVDPATNVLIVVDQFEELFRFRQRGFDSQEAASAFVKLLLHASDEQDAKIFIAITMRSDYLGDCADIPGLAESVNDGEYLIPRLRRQQRRDAIEKPVNVGGAVIAPRLVQKLLNEVGDDADQLPVMQHALMRTWDVWEADHADAEPIDLRHYEAAGRMEAALSHHADAIYDELPSNAHRDAAEKIFKTLTERGPDNREIRRPTVLSKMVEISGCEREVIDAVIEAYRKPGVTFLMPLAEVALEPETVIDISHESLMRVWTRLRSWVEDEAQSARIFQRLSDTARLHGDGKAGLYKDPDLQIAQSWREEHGPTEAWSEQYGGGFEGAMAFLETSHETAEAETRAEEEIRQRELEQARALAESEAKAPRVFKRFALAVAMLALAAVVLAAWALDSRSEVQELLGVTEAAKREVEGVYKESKHNQGVLWLERANRQRFEKSLVGAQLSAARAIGFEGYGREACEEAFKEAYPPLLRRGSEAWKRAESLIKQDSNLTPIWSSPVSANLKAHVHPGISPDGKIVAGADHSKTLLLWDGVSGDALAPIELSMVADDVALPSSDRLLVQGSEGVEVWSLPERQLVRRFPVSEGSSLAYADERRWLAIAEKGTVGIWNAVTGEKIRELPSENMTDDYSMDSQGRYFLYEFEDGLALRSIDDAGDGEPLPLDKGWEVTSFYFVDGGDHVVATVVPRSEKEPRRRSGGRFRMASPDEETWLHLWKVDSKELVRRQQLEPGTRVRMGGDFTRAAEYGHTVWLRIRSAMQQHSSVMNVFTGEITLLEPKLNVLGFDDDRFSGEAVSNGRALLSDESKLVVATYPEFQATKAPRGHSGPVFGASFTSDGRHVISTGSDGVLLWDASTGELVKRLSSEAANKCAFSADGQWVATTHGSDSEGSDSEGRVNLWSTEVWELVGQIDGTAFEVAFSPDSRLLAYEGEDSTIQIVGTGAWKPIGSPIQRFPPREEPDREDTGRSGGRDLFDPWITDLVFSPDGKFLAVPGGLGPGNRAANSPLLVLHALDAQEETQVLVEEGTPDVSGVDAVAFSQDGRWLVWVSGSTVHVQDRLTGEREVLPGGDLTTTYSAVAFSHDGQFLAGAEERGSIVLWNFHSRERVAQIRGHGGYVTSIQFAPDGRSLLSTSRDGTVRLWETIASKRRVRPGGETNYKMIEFLPSGQLLGVAAGAFDYIEPATGRLIRRVSTDANLRRLVPQGSELSRDGSRLVVMDQAGFRMARWLSIDTGTGEILDWGESSPDIVSLGLSPTHPGVVKIDRDEGRLEYLMRPGEPPVKVFENVQALDFPKVTFSPDGARLASVSGLGVSHITVLSGPDFQTETKFSKPENFDGFRLQAFHPTKPNWFASSDSSGSIALYDADSGDTLATYSMTADGASPVHFARIRFSPDGQTVMVRNERNGVRFHRMPDLVLEREFETGSNVGLGSERGNSSRYHVAASFAFDISPDGNYLAVNVWSEGIYIWNLTDGDGQSRPTHLASVMDYLVFADPGRSEEEKKAAREADGGGGVSNEKSFVEQPESLSIKLSDNLYGEISHELIPVSPSTHYGILQRDASSEEQDRELFLKYLGVGNWSAAGAVLRRHPGEGFAEARQQYVEAVSTAAMALPVERKELALTWLTLAEGVVSDSEVLNKAREAVMNPPVRVEPQGEGEGRPGPSVEGEER